MKIYGSAAELHQFVDELSILVDFVMEWSGDDKSYEKGRDKGRGIPGG